MRRESHHPPRCDALSGFSNAPQALNETLPQRGCFTEWSDSRDVRRVYPSVRPLTAFSAVSSSKTSKDRYIDPSQDKVFTMSEISPSRRRSNSVASSCRSTASLAPSSLRYIGLQPKQSYSAFELLGKKTTCKAQHSPEPPRCVATERFSVQRNRAAYPEQSPARERPSTRVLPYSAHVAAARSHPREEPVSFLSNTLHPLLRQALLLTSAAEVEGRLSLCQMEADAFDDILALFSVAKEVEAVRVAAFDMFELEANARRALYAQQRRERRIHWYCYLEDYNNAVLSQEVRALQLGDNRLAFNQPESLLRSRSASLQQHANALFEPRTDEKQLLSSPRQVVPSVEVESTMQPIAAFPKRELTYPANNSPPNSSPLRTSGRRSQPAESSSTYSYSVSTNSSPSQADKNSSRTTESLDVTGIQAVPLTENENLAMEGALDDRIARQQLLLASGETRQNTRASPLFSTRQAPKRMTF